MGTENVGPLLRSLIQMLRPNRVLEIEWLHDFLLEGLVNNRRYYDDGCLFERFLEILNYDPRLVIIDDMSPRTKTKRFNWHYKIQYVEIVEGRFQVCGAAKSELRQFWLRVVRLWRLWRIRAFYRRVLAYLFRLCFVPFHLHRWTAQQTAFCYPGKRSRGNLQSFRYNRAP